MKEKIILSDFEEEEKRDKESVTTFYYAITESGKEYVGQQYYRKNAGFEYFEDKASNDMKYAICKYLSEHKSASAEDFIELVLDHTPLAKRKGDNYPRLVDYYAECREKQDGERDPR